jgi:hypothetical protein
MSEASTTIMCPDCRVLMEVTPNGKCYRCGRVLTTIAGDGIHEFSSGAKSSGRKPRYDLIPAYALERIARRFELGAEKYGVNNWKKGANDPEFIMDRLNHAMEHIKKMQETVQAFIDVDTDKPHVAINRGIFGDDDAAAAILNSIFFMEWQENTAKGKPIDAPQGR